MVSTDEALKKFYELKKSTRPQKSIWDNDVTAETLERMTEAEKRAAFYDYGMGDF